MDNALKTLTQFTITQVKAPSHNEKILERLVNDLDLEHIVPGSKNGQFRNSI